MSKVLTAFIVSVPSFGDSFFIRCRDERCCTDLRVSVPSFGDSFFIRVYHDDYRSRGEFPSPHSGILFLSCRYDMPPSLNIFAIFRRILHFLAQKGSPLTQSIHFSPYPSASARIKSFFHPYCTVSNSS